jgi:hypothetical protein
MNRIRRWLARLTGPSGTPVRPASQLTGLTAHQASWPDRDS